ncbi:hypothetical protein RD110_23955 [Rhodoferax koreense]|uniref:Solute-binding protein family 3/N-terminal domain-containing protein n=1 Tax=Rhodoferax koreensis TaxID=1842727 RepID=A0A1P8K1K0_9BURK|nr:hypothetical protein [Rhodoferax koreense]APW39884.1 hypothetical protein RD110_23955 [Rhodoferax koreense]
MLLIGVALSAGGDGAAASQAARSGTLPTTTIIHPRPESGSDVRYGYYWRLLEAALQATEAEYGPFRLEQAPAVMNHQRSMEALVGGQIQVYLRVLLPPDYADRLALVPVPLDKGLSGYRVLLIHKDTQARLAGVRTLADLRAFTVGQGLGWADIDILANAQLRVVSGRNYEGLFDMLAGKRFDIFPRGINEVVAEYQRHRTAEPALAIDRSLLLAYPLARYFLVSQSPEGQRLRRRLELGLERLRADGRMEKMYTAFKKDILHGLDLRGRRLIRIANPAYEQPMYRLHEAGYWDTLEAETGR